MTKENMMTDADAELLRLCDEVDAVLPDATPPPWQSLNEGNQYIETSYLPTARCVGASVVTGPRRPWNPHAYVAFGFKPEEFEKVRFIDADAELVALLRNGAPALLFAARESVRLRALLTERDGAALDDARMCDVEGCEDDAVTVVDGRLRLTPPGSGRNVWAQVEFALCSTHEDDHDCFHAFPDAATESEP